MVTMAFITAVIPSNRYIARTYTGKKADVYGTGRTPFEVNGPRTCTICIPFQSMVGPLSRGIEVSGLNSALLQTHFALYLH